MFPWLLQMLMIHPVPTSPKLVRFVQNSRLRGPQRPQRLRVVVKERENPEKFISLAKRVSLVVVHVGEFRIKCWNKN